MTLIDAFQSNSGAHSNVGNLIKSAESTKSHSTLGLKVSLVPNGIITPIVILECEK